MGLFVLDMAEKPNVKTRLETVKNNLNLFLRHSDKSPYNYLITDFALKYLDDVKTGLSKLSNWHKVDPSQQTIDKFWEEFNEARKYSQSCNSIFVSAFQSALYDHLNDLNLVENSSSDYILVDKDDYYQNIVLPINERVILRSGKYFESGGYSDKIIGYTTDHTTQSVAYMLEQNGSMPVSLCKEFSREI